MAVTGLLVVIGFLTKKWPPWRWKKKNEKKHGMKRNGKRTQGMKRRIASGSSGLTVTPAEKKDLPVKCGPIKNLQAALKLFRNSGPASEEKGAEGAKDGLENPKVLVFVVGWCFPALVLRVLLCFFPR